MSKIREILEKYLGTENEFGTVPRDIMFSENNGTFDELEKELKTFIDSLLFKAKKDEKLWCAMKVENVIKKELTKELFKVVSKTIFHKDFNILKE